MLFCLLWGLGALTVRHGTSPLGPLAGSSALPTGHGHYDSAEFRRAFARVATCRDPANAPDEAGPEVLADIADSIDSPHELVETYARPLTMFNSTPDFLRAMGLTRLTPHHRAIGLVRHGGERTTLPYADSACMEFDYDGTGPDPAGCRFFAKSFTLVQRARNCIRDALDESPTWQEYRRTYELDSPVEPANPAQACGSECAVLDTLRRADEVLRMVGFKALPAMDAKEQVEKKIQRTVTVKSRHAGLELGVVRRVRECFHVPEHGSTPASAYTLHRALPCLPLMWDSGDVPGYPEQPLKFGATNWDERLLIPATRLPVPADWKAPSVCGRAALAFVAQPLTQARGKMVGFGPFKKKIGPYSLQCGMVSSPSTKWCLEPDVFNCICAELCFEKALSHVCYIEPACCANPPDDDTARSTTATSDEGDSESDADLEAIEMRELPGSQVPEQVKFKSEFDSLELD